MQRRDFLKLIGWGAPLTAAAAAVLEPEVVAADAPPPPAPDGPVRCVVKFTPGTSERELDAIVRQLERIDVACAVLPSDVQIQWVPGAVPAPEVTIETSFDGATWLRRDALTIEMKPGLYDPNADDWSDP